MQGYLSVYVEDRHIRHTSDLVFGSILPRYKPHTVRTTMMLALQVPQTSIVLPVAASYHKTDACK